MSLVTCDYPGCTGVIQSSNVHKIPEVCPMNPNGTPTGCDSPEIHHPFVPRVDADIAEVASLLGHSDIIWPKYGSDTVEDLAERIVTLIRERERERR